MQLAAAHRDRRRQAILLAVLAAVMLASQAFSDSLTRNIEGVPTLWAFGALLTVGLILLPPARRVILIGIALVGHMAIGVAVGDSLVNAGAMAVIDVLEAFAAWRIALRFFNGQPRVRNMQQFALLATVTAPVALGAALLTAAVFTLTLGEDFALVLWNRFICGALGMIVVLPAVLTLMDAEHRRTFMRPLPERLGLMALVAGLASAVFTVPGAEMPFLLFPAVMLVAFRLGPRGAAQASLLAACIALPLAVHGLWDVNLYTWWAPQQKVRIVQVFIGLLFATSLATGLALAQQERLRRLLIRRELLTRAARARALAATEAKTEFLATMSHEIRTPLNSMLGFAQLLTERQDLPGDARRQLALIESAGAALLTVVNDILDFSRVEAGQVELLFQPTSAAAVLHDAVGIIRGEAQNKGLSVEVEVIDPIGGLHDLDGLRLRQALLNLLTNAVKFTDRGRIRAYLSLEPGEMEDRLRFEIIDTGIGIPIDLQPRLFQRFSQLDAATTRAYGGAGLGLAISKALVELMGGRIGVESAPGHGSVFWIELTAPRAEQLAPTEPAPRADPSAARILLVDDHPMNREIGAALLTLVGCRVDTADNGREAVEMAARGGYDVILMDIHMPEMDGLAATRAIRALDGDAGQVPIIAMSADALPQQVERCYAAGMVDHIAKPVQRELLYAKVSRWLEAGR